MIKTFNFIGLIFITVAIIMFFIKTPFAKEIIKHQNIIWGFNFSEKTVKRTEKILITISICSFIIGVLIFFRVIK